MEKLEMRPESASVLVLAVRLFSILIALMIALIVIYRRLRGRNVRRDVLFLIVGLPLFVLVTSQFACQWYHRHRFLSLVEDSAGIETLEFRKPMVIVENVKWVREFLETMASAERLPSTYGPYGKTWTFVLPGDAEGEFVLRRNLDEPKEYYLAHRSGAGESRFLHIRSARLTELLDEAEVK